jgi:hypothetical protein
MRLAYADLDDVLEEPKIASQTKDLWIRILIRPDHHILTLARVSPIGGDALERASSSSLVVREQMKPNIFGREVEYETVVLFVHQKAMVTLGQQFTFLVNGNSIPPSEDIDAVVRPFDVSRLLHSVLLRQTRPSVDGGLCC